MSDKISEVGKSLGKTRRDAEAAIRRVQPIHPKLERVRDVFDLEVPFEMEFETEPNNKSFYLDLYFNKPPPMSECEDGQFEVKCQQFTFTTEEPGPHLINLGESYWSGTLQVYVEDVLLDPGQYSEYDPANGLVYVVDQGVGITITICYATNTWVFDCPEELDPLNGTQNNTGGNAHTYSLGAPTFGADDNSGGVSVDTNDTTQIPQFATYTSVSGRHTYTAEISDHAGLLEWTSNVGFFGNYPSGTISASAEGSLNFIPIYNVLPYTGAFYPLIAGTPIVDGNNCRCTFSLQTIIGTENLGTTWSGFFGGYPERINMDLEIGPLRIFIETDHDLLHPGNPVPFGPRLHVAIENSGDIDYLGDEVPGGIIVQSNGSFAAENGSPFVFNEPLFFFIDINRPENRITILVNGVDYSFTNPVFRQEFLGLGQTRVQNYTRGKLEAGWQGVSFIEQPGYFALRMNDVHLSPCGWHPQSAVT